MPLELQQVGKGQVQRFACRLYKDTSQISEESAPVNLFLVRYKISTRSKLLGSVPLRPADERSTETRFLVISSDAGIVPPIKGLLEQLKAVKLDKSPIELGIGPWRLLLETSIAVMAE